MQYLCNPWCSNLYAPDIHEHPHVWNTPLNMIVCDPLSDWWVRTQGAWTDSSNFSCYYQCQLLTKLNPVVVFDVVAHTKRLNASTVCCDIILVDMYLFNLQCERCQLVLLPNRSVDWLVSIDRFCWFLHWFRLIFRFRIDWKHFLVCTMHSFCAI